jgi:hypothetical protein
VIVATPLVLLVQQAHQIGVTVARRRDGTLGIRTTAAADAVARALRARDAEVLRLYDWSRATVADGAPCLLCGKSAMLRDPVDGRPCHKTCVDVLLKPGGAAVTDAHSVVTT